MKKEEIKELALSNQAKARVVLEKSGIAKIWEDAGCRVNLVGSLRMGLLASHKDIDLHVYSKGITIGRSFAIASCMADNPDVVEIKCINGLNTDEHCVAWHVMYRYSGELWKFDIIHIEDGSFYDGYFEHMADRIVEVATQEQKDLILRLKFETPEDCDFHGVEYYEAVIADGVSTFDELSDWIKEHRKKPMNYWIP